MKIKCFESHYLNLSAKMAGILFTNYYFSLKLKITAMISGKDTNLTDALKLCYYLTNNNQNGTK